MDRTPARAQECNRAGEIGHAGTSRASLYAAHTTARYAIASTVGGRSPHRSRTGRGKGRARARRTAT
eukprot:8744505-Pyramimonas_sp.AAC.1